MFGIKCETQMGPGSGEFGVRLASPHTHTPKTHARLRAPLRLSPLNPLAIRNLRDFPSRSQPGQISPHHQHTELTHQWQGILGGTRPSSHGQPRTQRPGRSAPDAIGDASPKDPPFNGQSLAQQERSAFADALLENRVGRNPHRLGPRWRWVEPLWPSPDGTAHTHRARGDHLEQASIGS